MRKRLLTIRLDSARCDDQPGVDLLEAFARDDSAIRQDVAILVRDILLLADCGLRVDHGTVSIEGSVNRTSEAYRLLSMVAGLPGVVAVRPKIQCAADDRMGEQAARRRCRPRISSTSVSTRHSREEHHERLDTPSPGRSSLRRAATPQTTWLDRRRADSRCEDPLPFSRSADVTTPRLASRSTLQSS
jgi:hypothetical protein